MTLSPLSYPTYYIYFYFPQIEYLAITKTRRIYSFNR